MSRKSVAAAMISGLFIGSLALIPSAAGAAPIIENAPSQTATMQSAKLAKLQRLTQQASGSWITVQKYPSPYGSLSGISKVVYGNTSHWQQLCVNNHIRNCNVIYAGQRIYVSSPTPQATVTKPVVNTVINTASWVHPLRVGNPTSSCFGMRWGVMHKGIDYPAPYGTPIRSVGYGTVVKAGWIFHGYGISVLINHGGNLYTHYAHASRLAVNPGQHVVPGQIIAYVGATGDATGKSLAFRSTY